jgi:hydroxyacylglutathione hydrolase
MLYESGKVKQPPLNPFVQETQPMLEVVPIPALRDNYIFLLVDSRRGLAAVVDPSEPASVLNHLDRENLVLDSILVTHFHADHTGGNRDLLKKFPNTPVFGGERETKIPCLNTPVRTGAVLERLGHRIEILDLSAHTKGHVGYYFPPENGRNGELGGDLFSGDTIFGATCGAIFEGTVADMFFALERIRNLPAATRIWCAHEYTALYVRTALQFDPDNRALRDRWDRLNSRANHAAPTIPLLLAEECLTNPYLRWDAPELCQRFGTAPGLATFEAIIAAIG